MIIGIDIGSSTVRAVSCVHEEDYKFPKVLAVYKKPVEGITKGNITDVDELSEILLDAVEYLEDTTGMRASHTLVSIAGTHLSSSHASGFAQISRGDGAITDLDIDNAIKDGQKGIPDNKNKTIIHSIPISYKIDGHSTTGDIIGLHGNKLEVKTLFVTCSTHSIDALKKALDKARIRVTDIVTGPIAESVTMLTKKQKNAGILLLNIGAQTTSMLVYENNLPILVSILPVGGDDMTRDLALGLKISLEEAEEVKCNLSELKHNKRKVEEIIEARIEDLCIKINKELTRINRVELIPAGVIVCGDSARIERLDYMLRLYLKLPIKITKNELLKISNDVLEDTQWARSYGLTFFAPNDTSGTVIKELITSGFQTVKNFFIKFLP